MTPLNQLGLWSGVQRHRIAGLLLPLTLAAGTGCEAGDKAVPHENVELTRPKPIIRPAGIPANFFPKEPTSFDRELLKQIEKGNRMCRNTWGKKFDQQCRLLVATGAAIEHPSVFDIEQIREWAKGELGRFYERYISQNTRHRSSAADFLLVQALERVLLTSKFGPPVSRAELDTILSGIRNKTGRSHIPSARAKPITWIEIEQSPEPLEVRIQDIPSDLKVMASKINLPLSMTSHMEIPKGTTLWEFLVQNVAVVIFVSHIAPTTSEKMLKGQSMLGVADTLFFKSIILNVGGWKKLLGEDSATGLLSTLGHEAYHNFFHQRLKSKDESLIDAVLLNERNGTLFQAEILRQRFEQERRANTDQVRLQKIFRHMANFRLMALAANLPLQYPLGDETLRADLPAGINSQHLSRYPAPFVSAYLAKRRMTPTQFVNDLRRQLKY